jgi:hypothetical protein
MGTVYLDIICYARTTENFAFDLYSVMCLKHQGLLVAVPITALYEARAVMHNKLHL